MTHHELNLKEIQKDWHGTYRAYLIGFLLSLLITCLSFYLVHIQAFSKQLLIFVVVGLALTQAIVQLIFFLHLGQEKKPRWESWVFYFMVVILVIVVLGSLWIMDDLNNRMMSDMPNMQMGGK